jgi:serine/threonine protein phosphatase PrpC
MSSNILAIDIEASSGNGEDSHLICDDDRSEFVVIGAFDGLGGRSAGFDGMTGGKIASQRAVRIAKVVLESWDWKLSEKAVIDLQSRICQTLKSDAESKMEKSRLSGTLTGKRLCTTIVLASIPKSRGTENDFPEIRFAWMGDSRVYFLSPKKGLQQLTVDDLEIHKDAFQMIREDPRMSQYLTADISDNWKIHFAIEKLDENGCILVCTDGCFQYLPTPWDFEKLLLETLTQANTLEEWKSLLVQRYEQIKQDDISLLLYPFGFYDFSNLASAYQRRLEQIAAQYNTNASKIELDELWKSYRSDYEAKLQKNLKPVVKTTTEISESSPVEGVDGKEYENHNLGISAKISLDPEITSDENALFDTNTDVDRDYLELEALLDKEDDNDSDDTINYADQMNASLEEAIVIFEDALRNNDDSQINTLIDRFHRELENDPNNLKIKFLLGRAYLTLEYFQDSIKYFKSAIDPRTEYSSEAVGFIAEAYYGLKNYLHCCSYFEKLKLAAKSEAKSTYYFFSDDRLIIYAKSLYIERKYEYVLQICDVIAQRYSNSPFENYMRGFENYMRGVVYHKFNDLTTAKYFLEEACTAYNNEFETNHSDCSYEWLKTVNKEYKIVVEKLSQSY